MEDRRSPKKIKKVDHIEGNRMYFENEIEIQKHLFDSVTEFIKERKGF